MKIKFEKFSIKLGLFSLLIISAGLSGFKKGDCTTNTMTAAAIEQLKKFTLVDEFPFYMKKRKKGAELEFKKQVINLNRGVRYKFYTIRNEDYDGLPILSIYNNEKQEFLIGSTYNQKFNKFYSELEFECKTSGNYCLSLSFHEGMEGCAIGVFAALIKDEKS